MSVHKSITIYEPVDIPHGESEAQIAAATPGFETKQHAEPIFIDSTMPSVLIKNIIFNSIPIEAASARPIRATDEVAAGGAHKPKNKSATDNPADKVGLIVARSSTKKTTPADYTLTLQLPVAITTYIIGSGFTIRAAGDTINLVGLWFDHAHVGPRGSIITNNFGAASLQSKALSGVLGIKTLDYYYDYPKVPRLAAGFTRDLLNAEPTPSAPVPHLRRLDTRVIAPLAPRIRSDDDALAKIRRMQAFTASRALLNQCAIGATMHALYAQTKAPEMAPREPHQPIEKTANYVGRDQRSPATTTMAAVLEAAGAGHLATRPIDHARCFIFSTPAARPYVRLIVGAPNAAEGLERFKTAKEQRMAATHARADAQARAITAASATAWQERIARREFQTSLERLAPNEAAVVTSCYERESAQVRNQLNNKCPHIGLYRAVMRSRTTTFDAAKWKALTRYVTAGATTLPDKTANTLLSCIQCGFPVMCPHVYLLYSESTTTTDQESMMAHIIDNFTTLQGDISDTKYCRICGEVIQKQTTEGETWQQFVTSSADALGADTLGTTMLTEIQQTLAANVDLSKSNISPTELVTNIATCINPYIRRYELKLARVKTNTEIIINFSLYLIISIYTLMVVVYLMAVLHGDISLRGLGIQQPKKSAVSAAINDPSFLAPLFSHVYKLVTTQRAVIIDKIPAFTPERIKKFMTRAYKQVSGASIVIETSVISYKPDLVTDNPMYKLLAYGHRVGTLMAVATKDARATTPLPAIATVLGVDFSKIDSLKYLYESAPMPPKWPIAKGDAYTAYCWDTFAAAAKRLIADTFALDDNNRPAIAKEYAAFVARCAETTVAETLTRNFARGTSLTTEPTRPLKDVDIGRVYCPTASEHRFDLFIVGDKALTMAEMKARDPDAEPIGAMKCSRCGALICASDPANSAAIHAAVAAKTRTSNFFSYFAIRCPEGFIHKWSDGACTACGMKRKMSDEERTAWRTKYAAKYAAAHAPRVTQKPAQDVADASMIVSVTPSMVNPVKTPIYKPWTNKNDSITTCADTFGLKYNMLVNIGLTRGVPITAILSGAANPANHVKDAQWSLQIAAAAAYVDNIVTSWNRFIVCASSGLAAELVELCETAGNEVRSAEPIDLTAFWAERAFRATEAPRLYANWMINQLCELLVGVHGRTPSGPAKKFAVAAADAIVTAETNMSKPAVYKNVIAAAKEKMAAAMDAQTGEIPTGETDVEAKSFITNILADGESMDTGNIDVESYADSFGDDNA